MICHTFSSLTPLFFSRTSVEFYKISMRDGTPPQRGALMAALTRRFDHFCRNEYGFIEAESDQIFSWEPPLMLPLLGNAWFDHFCLNEYGFIKAKSLKFQDRLAPTTEKRTPNFFNLPWEISDLSCFTCFPSWFLTSSGWWEIENIGYAYAANLFECYFSRFACVSVRVIRRRCARSAWNFKYRMRLHAATCGYMRLHAAACFPWSFPLSKP